MSEVEAIAIGSHVRIGPLSGDRLNGNVMAIEIKGNPPAVSNYQVVWWSGRERHCEWMSPHEVRATSESERTKIGFASEEAWT